MWKGNPLDARRKARAAEKARANHFFVRGNAFRDQLRQVAERFPTVPGRVMTRRPGLLEGHAPR